MSESSTKDPPLPGIVIPCAVGLACSAVPLYLASFGVFISPLEADFGWTRSLIAGSLTAHVLTSVVCYPVAGRIIDRVGPRPVIMTSLVLVALSLAAYSQLKGSVVMFYTLAIVTAIAGAGASPVAYSKVIVASFTNRRGLALGFSLAGVGVGSALVPVVTQSIVTHYSWQTAYLVLAAIPLFIALPVVTVMLPGRLKSISIAASAHSDGQLTEITDTAFITMAASFLLVGVGYTGISVHLIPMLIDRGWQPGTAALAPMIAGFSVVIGRLCCGWLLDRIFAPRIAIVAVSLTAVGVVLAVYAPLGPLTFVSAALLGLSAGAEIDVMAYLVSRYFGIARFGLLYGILNGTYFVGTAIGPLAVGIFRDTTGAYAAAGIMICSSLIVSAGLFSSLRRYPQLPSASAA